MAAVAGLLRRLRRITSGPACSPLSPWGPRRALSLPQASLGQFQHSPLAPTHAIVSSSSATNAEDGGCAALRGATGSICSSSASRFISAFQASTLSLLFGGPPKCMAPLCRTFPSPAAVASSGFGTASSSAILGGSSSGGLSSLLWSGVSRTGGSGDVTVVSAMAGRLRLQGASQIPRGLAQPVRGVQVVVVNDNADRAIKKWKSKLREDNIIRVARARQRYWKPAELKRMKAKESLLRRRKKEFQAKLAYIMSEKQKGL